MAENKTKSGKTAYYTKQRWIEVQFEELMKAKGIKRGCKEYISSQELYFQGASIALDEMPESWKIKLSLGEPI